MRVVIALVVLVALLPMFGQSRAERQHTIQNVLETELSSGEDCPNAHTTYDENMCLDKALERTQANFKVFYDNVFALVGNDGLKQAQAQWEIYREKTCNAVGEWWNRGSIRPSQEVRCELQLTRSRMRDLDSIYLALHIK